jgi:hypothetical protein
LSVSGAGDGPSFEPHHSRQRRALSRDALVVGIVAVLLIAVLIGILLVHDSGAKGSSGTTTTTASRSTSSTVSAKTSCSSWPWGDELKAEPAALQTGHPASGIYVWSTFYSWNVRVVGMPGIAGTIASSGTLNLVSVSPVSSATTTHTPGSLNFKTTAPNGDSQIAFAVRCPVTGLLFSFQTSQGLVSVSDIKIGGKGKVPTANPFSITRRLLKTH